MKPVLIKACCNNECMRHRSRIEQLLTQFEKVEFMVEDCLGRCRVCEETPYVLVNQRLEFGDDMEELLEAIHESITEIQIDPKPKW